MVLLCNRWEAAVELYTGRALSEGRSVGENISNETIDGVFAILHIFYDGVHK